MIFDRETLLRRFAPDPLSIWRRQIERLRELGVQIAETSHALAKDYWQRLGDEMIDPDQAARYATVVAEGKKIELAGWLRPGPDRRGNVNGSMAWLRGGDPGAQLIRFERRTRLPITVLSPDTMQDAWACSWPGAFANFNRSRVLVVTVDYQLIRWEGHGHASPYR